MAARSDGHEMLKMRARLRRGDQPIQVTTDKLCATTFNNVTHTT